MGRLRRRPGCPAGARPTAAAVSLALLVAGCGDRTPPPARLVDGTTPPALPAALRDIGPAVSSRVTVVEARRLDSPGRSCVASFRPEFRISPGATVVRRTGAAGESLTFEDAQGAVVLGCYRTAGASASARRWCGRSVGRLVAGRLRDMRLDIACRTGDAGAVGFGWIEPGPATRWVVARVGPIREVAAVAASLPVRIPTGDVDQPTSTATFAVVEYTASGEVVRRYRARVGVAG